MKIISKSQILALTLSLGIFLALGSVSAFTPPTGSATVNNTEGPIDVSSTSQLKDGGLSVDAFLANGSATFVQALTLKGLVNGGTPAGTNSTVSFGDGTYQVGVNATGSIRANTFFTSLSLAHADAGLKPICANSQGYLILCGTSGGPMCGNGVLESGEQCDDYNNTNGDGCSSSCQFENVPGIYVVNNTFGQMQIDDVSLGGAYPYYVTLGGFPVGPGQMLVGQGSYSGQWNVYYSDPSGSFAVYSLRMFLNNVLIQSMNLSGSGQSLTNTSNWGSSDRLDFVLVSDSGSCWVYPGNQTMCPTTCLEDGAHNGYQVCQ